MAFDPKDIQANREFFAAKLKAERQKNDVARRAKGEAVTPGFVLLDVRGRDAFAKAHVAGALCLPLDELDAIAPGLPRDRELVTYCWNHT